MEAEKQKPYSWLKPFKPGQSGNPAGRPKKPNCIPDILREIGALNCPEELIRTMKEKFRIVGEVTLQRAALMATYLRAVKGEAWAMEFIAERTEGKAVQQVDLSGPPGALVAIISPPDEKEKQVEEIRAEGELAPHNPEI